MVEWGGREWWREEGKDVKHRGGGVPPLFHAVDETRKIPDILFGNMMSGVADWAAPAEQESQPLPYPGDFYAIAGARGFLPSSSRQDLEVAVQTDRAERRNAKQVLREDIDERRALIKRRHAISLAYRQVAYPPLGADGRDAPLPFGLLVDEHHSSATAADATWLAAWAPSTWWGWGGPGSGAGVAGTSTSRNPQNPPPGTMQIDRNVQNLAQAQKVLTAAKDVRQSEEKWGVLSPVTRSLNSFWESILPDPDRPPPRGAWREPEHATRRERMRRLSEHLRNESRVLCGRFGREGGRAWGYFSPE